MMLNTLRHVASQGARRLASPPLLLGLLLVLLAPVSAWANYGFVQTYAILNSNNTGFTYRAGGNNPDGAAAFTGSYFGTFDGKAGNTLVLGGEVRSFKNGTDNVQGSRIYYRVYPTNGTAPNFSSLNLYFSDESNNNGTTNQKWTDVNNAQGQNQDAPVNLLSGLTTAGNYTIEVYWTTFTASDTQYDSNFGNNFKATFDLTNPLPVTLTAFTAQRQGADALLSWTTASETNNAGYEVQVSSSGEAADFRALGFVAAASPTSQTARAYTFRDQEAGKTGLRYYRLRQLDLSGPATYSPVRSVQFDAVAAGQLAAAPNPFGSSLALFVTLPQAATSATLTLTDALGREVLRQPVGALPAGASQLTINAEALRAGVYVARLALPTGPQTLRVLKQ